MTSRRISTPSHIRDKELMVNELWAFSALVIKVGDRKFYGC
jgi:hypothetical protein